MNHSTEPKLVDSGPAFEIAGLLHIVRQPAGDGPHPTIVLIQGRAGNEEVMWVFARTIPDNWLLVAPRAIVEDPEEGGYSWHLPTGNFPTLGQFDEAVERLAHFIQALPSLYNADLDHLYLMGFSQGAAASFALAFAQPELVQGIAALVGFIPYGSNAAIANAPLYAKPVFMIAGTKDERIPLELAQQSAEAAQAAGAFLEYREYSTGHKLTADGMRKLKAWWAERDAEL